MMTALLEKYLSPEAYLEMERKAEYKSEYFNGEMYQMAGASLIHDIIVANVTGRLRPQPGKRPFKVLPGNMRLRLPIRNYAYPDVLVVCGKPQLEDKEKDILLNPTVLIEVLADSTEAKDRGLKAWHYRKIESLSEYILIDQHTAKIELYTRKANGRWMLSEVNGLSDTLEIASLECKLAMTDIYDKVEIRQNVLEFLSQLPAKKNPQKKKKKMAD
jgi:Uma2 family endonuclease